MVHQMLVSWRCYLWKKRLSFQRELTGSSDHSFLIYNQQGIHLSVLIGWENICYLCQIERVVNPWMSNVYDLGKKTFKY